MMSLRVSVFQRLLPAFVLMAASLFLPVSQSIAAPTGVTKLDFDVLRNGQPFGRHTVTMSRDAAGGLAVASAVRLEAKVGPVVAYRYRSACQEVWKATILESLNCTTTKGGKTKRVAVTRMGDGLGVSVDGGAQKPAPDVVPIAPWNMLAMNETSVLAPDDGLIMPLKVTDLGTETIQIGDKSVSARRVRYKSNLVLDSWYDADGQWLKAIFVARGQNIEYRARF